MIHRIEALLCLFSLFTICLTSCTKTGGDTAPAQKTADANTSAPGPKSADEKRFEADIMHRIEKKQDLNGAGEHGIAILAWAVEFNYVDAARMLLQNGADPNITPKPQATETVLFSTATSLTYGNDPLEREKVDKSRTIAELLIQHGANVNHSSLIKNTPLHQAALRGRADLCELFIQNGAKVNATATLGDTPLHMAAKEGYWEAAQVLLENGAEPKTTNQLGQTALSLAEERKEEPLYRKIRREMKTYEPGADYDRTIEVLKEHGGQ